jgi:ankyrin repeat protein
MQADRLDRNDLMYAVIDRNADAVDDRLKAGDDVNHQEKAGWTALHFGARNNDSVIVQKLLGAGADHRLLDNHGNTALFRAVFSYDNGPECVSVLLAAGADPDSLNNYGVSPRSLAHSIGNYDTAKFFPDK